MQQAASIRIMSGRRTVVLYISAILYVRTSGHNCEIHVSDGQVYVTRQSLTALERQLGADFIRIDRGCIVAVMAIHDITDQVNLVNGQRLEYALRNRAGLVAQLQQAQQRMIGRFTREGVPATEAEYRNHYRSFDAMPFAFADIEMVFDENRRAVDWIFLYGNPALARLEKLPLERLIGSSFGSLFRNMDDKWLRLYERATLYGETLETVGYHAWEHAGYDFKKAVERAFELATEGGNVLLSPSCASFDMFSDYEARGRIFKEIVSRMESREA